MGTRSPIQVPSLQLEGIGLGEIKNGGSLDGGNDTFWISDPERDVVPLNTLRKPEETFVEKQKRV
jgi:hypothetical protein